MTATIAELAERRAQARAYRFDLEPLAAAWGDLSAPDLAERCGVDTRTVIRWRSVGLTVAQADAMACRVGLHPSLLWPDWWSVPFRRQRPREV